MASAGIAQPQSLSCAQSSKLVMLIVEDAPQARARVAAIAEAYKKQFRQQSVGIVTRPVCAGF